MPKYPNLALMHRAVSHRMGPRVAIKHKRNGKYANLTWNEFRLQADQVAAGLIQLGIQKNDRVALFSENRYEWIIADQAFFSAGAANVPLHAPLSPTQVQYQVENSGARGIIVSNQSQADKVFEILNGVPTLEFLISFEPIVVPESAERLNVLTWDGIKHRGGAELAALKAEIEERESKVTETDLATIIYTSGTTGPPKGVMLSHGNILSNTEEVLAISEIYPEDVLLSWLPYSHIYARTVDLYVSQLGELVIALGESVDTLLVNLAETQPHWMTAVPRFYEKVWAKVEALPPEVQAATLRKIFGPRLRHLSSGGAPLPKQICEAFNKAGIPLVEGYGLTETSPVITFNRIDNNKPGTVGQVIADVEVKIAEDGEILCKGPNVMMGYWENPEATAEVIVDGWFHTGDVGEIDADGFLSITDRKKDLIVTSTGKNVAPNEIERILKTDPLIDQAVVYGDDRNFITAMLVPNFEVLEAELAQRKISPESNGEFIGQPEIISLFDERVAELMQQVSQPERVRKCLVMSRPFSLEEKELTATLKVRRRHIIQKYEQEFAALYESK